MSDLTGTAAGRAIGEHDDAGSLVVELVVLTPVLFLLVLVAVVFGRVTGARQLITESARAGAQAAAVMPNASSAIAAAGQSAAVGTTGRHDPCIRTVVSTDVSQFRPGGSVTVTVVCTVDLADLAVPGLPGTATIRSSTTAPVDPYRSVQ